jgi:hypothetical protein
MPRSVNKTQSKWCINKHGASKIIDTFETYHQTTKLCDFTNTPNAQFIASPITSPELKADSFEVSPRLLNLIAKDQFGSSASEDAFMHLHDFCMICDM